MKMVLIPDPILKQKAKPINSFDKHLRNTIKDMEKLLIAQDDPPGVGLAAPQVGLPLQLFLMKTTPKEPTMVFINSSVLQIKIVKTKKKKKDDELKLEGCLSIPRVWGPVKRHSKIQLEYQDVHGNKKIEWFSGFKSTVIQHEIDHLNGILFTQRVLEQKGDLYEEKNGDLEKIKTI